MAEKIALEIGLALPLSNGAKVFAALGKDGDCICYALTAPDGLVTRFAVSHEALDAMVDVACELLKREASSVPSGVPTLPPAPQQALVWLYSHCRAIGMTAKSDSGKMEDDIALFTVNLQDRVKELKAAPAPQAVQGADQLDAQRYRWLKSHQPAKGLGYETRDESAVLTFTWPREAIGTPSLDEGIDAAIRVSNAGVPSGEVGK